MEPAAEDEPNYSPTTGHATDLLVELFSAPTEPDAEMVRWLLSEGANPNIWMDQGYTPLMLAARRGHLAAAKALLEGQTIINLHSPHGGVTAAHLAAGRGHIEMLSLLHQHGADLVARDDLGYTPLHEAALRDSISTIERLISLGVDINALGQHDKTPLFIASCASSPHTIGWLLDHGADPNLVTSFGQSALHHAAFRGLTDVVSQLIAHHANIHQREASGETALHHAAGGGFVDVAAQLLHAGADPNSADARGYTPLHLVVIQNKTEKLSEVRDIIWLLANHHANLNALDNPEDPNQPHDRKTPLEWAIVFNHDVQAECLMELGAFVPPHLCEHYGLAANRYEKAHERVAAFLANPAQACEQLLAEDIVYCANIGKEMEVLEHPAWQSKEAALQQLLLSLNPALQKQIFDASPNLLFLAASPLTAVDGQTIEHQPPHEIGTNRTAGNARS